MPSTHKTNYLKLNQWIGTDKPKRDDWNQDNIKLDEKLLSLTQGMEGHTKALGLHVTQSEKDRWSQRSGLTTFSYVGDGQATRTFSLNASLRFAILFAVNKPVFETAGNNYAYSGYLSSSGCSEGLSLTDKGFSVFHQKMVGPTGFGLRFNQEQVRYLCFYWT